MTSGTASGSANVVAFKNGGDQCLNGPVTSIVVDGDSLQVRRPPREAKGIAKYEVGQNAWIPLGAVTSLSFSGEQVQLTGNFTTLHIVVDWRGTMVLNAPSLACIRKETIFSRAD